MVRDLLGDYEPRGRVIQGVGRFIAFGLDDPFHITTVSGLTIYAIGKFVEKRSTRYGIRMAKIDMEKIRKDIRELTLDISGIHF
ncbi:hypothetical protein BFU36_05850 [Sulfolobus sp. A20]|uniref:hypothetical protein n=1 Tax=Saccharolobus sp. A20 TaxID=1891280 RepID=UPI0008461628|nr:hypothetical protein [Sulfolobus sp. A20]TRM75104.1 hypothetical protein DJ523_03490 [Sulfolobus sp. E5]TRM76436.1 hypothetical protein DJ532_07465 [Sulfolobus sp. A20-N-F8]TRM83291.1 hypothetical protein DJ531_06060 [Sulfolobus sp. A20-N-F6]TRM84999.1 hypothetical protein DJ522_02465 [Sulfolobus sp. F3]TRM89766.1 hypothetical protein DJ529_00760 [Sulfolobus sp. C3]TRM98558.1 hypothetical protein DJ530_10585 [Sulfolobus sp. E1]TRN02443.1 hypothetical protein DJ527_03945 [Sulfolobus sp. F1